MSTHHTSNHANGHKNNSDELSISGITLIFSFIGSLVGGFIIGMGIILIVLLDNPTILQSNFSDSIFRGFILVLFTTLLGFPFGFIPAGLAGWFLGWRKIGINKIHLKAKIISYTKIGLVGFIATLFCLVVIDIYTIFTDEFNSYDVFDKGFVVNLLPVCIVGALSAMVMGKLTLPKIQ